MAGICLVKRQAAGWEKDVRAMTYNLTQDLEDLE